MLTTAGRRQQRIERAVLKVARGQRATWRRHAGRAAWFDEADALDRLHAKSLSAADREHLEQWVEEGWFVVDDLVDGATVDALNEAMDSVWTTDEPMSGLDVLDVDGRASLSHAELLAVPASERLRMRDRSCWRIHGFQDHAPAADAVFRSAALARYAHLILDSAVRPIASINFARGSQQKLHQDMAVFHIHPGNRLVGAWIALEDIAPASGPLVFHPGSHRDVMFPEFDDYPQTNLRTAGAATTERYNAWVAEQATNWPEHRFIAKRGQVLFWHGMLIHGGSAIDDPSSSRRSMVVHYATPTADRGSQVTGPLNW